LYLTPGKVLALRPKVIQVEKNHALSVPENTGRRGLYKTVLCCWR